MNCPGLSSPDDRQKIGNRFGHSLFLGIAMLVILSACSKTVSRSEESALPARQSVPESKEDLSFVSAISNADLQQTAKEKFPLDAKRAMKYLREICKIGKRISGSTGMKTQQKIIKKHFEKLGAKVFMQPFQPAHPLTGKPVRMNNMIVSWHTTAKERVLVACHYDTRPFPDEDRRFPHGKFIGANDGASGIALLMEMGNHMKRLQPTYGVDFVFFDGEELIYIQRIRGRARQFGKFFLGSEFFAKWYRDHKIAHSYKFGILLDMVAGKNLQLPMEKNSLKLAPILTQSVWNMARKLNVQEFLGSSKYEIEDDHLPLNRIAKIPTTDIIDFDYPHWHKVKDTPRNCSGESMVKVGKVVMHWLENVPVN